ncbi:MAG TPA: SDR family oxidoreductase [Ferrovibrio sp.]|jgi:3-oxoacyl-[acyl-carrier protein] reductase|uniref:SDR family oxidoreductase n=1 Tax=Ferrovibrio sp. TaxID=1917215 RepID=UPI002ED0DE26
MDLEIAGRKALVCGASQGLGFACAAALAQEGVLVTLAARRAEALAKAAAAIAERCGQRPATVAADLSSPEGRQAVLAACPEPDILVTNAGGPPSKDFRTISSADWSAALDGNFLSAVELIRGSIDGMIARRFGRIVNITSMTVRMPVQQLDLSNATRLALTGYVAGVARQVAAHNVSINNLLPGTIATERILQLGDTARRLIEKVPAGRAGKPEEFAAACAFLCSAKAGFITGQNLLVDGGLCPITV